MSQFSTEDEAELRQNLRYEFVKYLRQYVESALGAVIEEETESCARGEGHAVLSGQNTLVHAVTRRTRESGEVVWEETLLDNLLNFSATPKGLLFLQQTGAINECVTYMFSRFTKKRQVSRCEKFGYSVMVTQVAATAPGVVALHSSGT
ncbi:hypothetical protein J4Q44_G00344010, partial [Coregonus suidteri]